MTTTVAHIGRIKRTAQMVYIGRPSKWGNPFVIPSDGTREEVISKYRNYITHRPDLLAALPELKDRILLCWCKPNPCHGDVLAELADKTKTRSLP